MHRTPEERRELATSIRNRRMAAGLTQPQLAVHADCSLNSITRFEAGIIPKRHSPLLDRILQVLDNPPAVEHRERTPSPSQTSVMKAAREVIHYGVSKREAAIRWGVHPSSVSMAVARLHRDAEEAESA